MEKFHTQRFYQIFVLISIIFLPKIPETTKEIYSEAIPIKPDPFLEITGNL